MKRLRRAQRCKNIAPVRRRNVQMLHGTREAGRASNAKGWWIMATAQKPVGRLPLRDPQDRGEARGESKKGRGQLETGSFQAVVLFIVLVTVLLWTARLLIDMLLQVAF